MKFVNEGPLTTECDRWVLRMARAVDCAVVDKIRSELTERCALALIPSRDIDISVERELHIISHMPIRKDKNV